MPIQYVFVDSVQRATPYGNNYTIDLTSDIKNVKQVDLVSASVPNVLFNITSGINCITCDGVPYSIPIGGYNAVQLAGAITCATPHKCDYVPLPYQGIFVFSNLNSSFTMTLNTPELQQRLGFSTKTVTSVSPVGTLLSEYYASCAGVAWSDQTVDLTTAQYAFLDIDEFRNNSLVDAKVRGSTTGNYGGDTIARTFAPIAMDVPPASIKTFKETSDYGYSVEFPGTPIPKISRLTVRWTDSQGKLIPFNGLERNSFLLRVHTVESPDDTSQGDGGDSKFYANRVLYAVIGVVLFMVFLLVSF